MRQLFLPACICLVTWSSATNSDPRFSFDEYSIRESTQHKFISRNRTGKSAPAETTSEILLAIEPDPIVQKPVAIKVFVPTDVLADLPTDIVLPDLAIEPPVPSGVIVNNGEPTGVPLPPIAKPLIARSTEEICEALTQSARNNDLPAPFFIRLLFQESRFDSTAVSASGAQGVAQFMPETAADMGLENPFDPLQAIPASARLLRELFHKFGNLGLAAAAYNAGPKRIADWLANKGKYKLPEETQGYVKNITGRPVEHWSIANARHPAPKLPPRAPCQDSAGLLAWNGPDAIPVPAPSPLRLATMVTARSADTKAAGKKTAVTKVTENTSADKKSENKSASWGTHTAQPSAHHAKAAAHNTGRTLKPKPERIAQR